MRTFVHVDGFNLCYGALKGTPFKWLNVVSLFEKVLQPCHEILKVKYFTARVSGTPTDPSKPQRQDIYLRALQTSRPEVEVYFGHFLSHPIRAPLLHPVGSLRTVEVVRTEEKGLTSTSLCICAAPSVAVGFGGEGDAGDGALVGEGVDLDAAFVACGEVTGEGEAEAHGAVAGGVEGLEDVGAALGADARAVVDDGDEDVAVAPRGVDLDGAGASGEVLHGVHGVVDDLCEEESDLGARGEELGEGSESLGDSGGALGAGGAQGVVDAGVEVDEVAVEEAVGQGGGGAESAGGSWHFMAMANDCYHLVG